MANPNLVTVVGVKVAAANIGEVVTVRNLTRGGKLTAMISGTDRNAVVNPAPSAQWQNGDVIQAEIRGSVDGVKQTKVQAGGAKIIIAASADTSIPSVNL